MIRDTEVDNAKATVGYFVNHIYDYVINTRTKLDEYKQPATSNGK